MRYTAVRLALAVILVLTGISAIWGGYMLMIGGWAMDAAWLEHTPFETWTIPGLATIALPGLGVLAAGIAVLAQAPHHRDLAIAAGVGLMAWVAVELAWLQVFHPVMHPLIFAIGAVTTGLGYALPRARVEQPADVRL
jgi:hypothetical protein